MLLEELRGHVRHMIESPHGNHVVSVAIEVLPRDCIDFILQEVSIELWLATYKFGCRVFQRLM